MIEVDTISQTFAKNLPAEPYIDMIAESSNKKRRAGGARLLDNDTLLVILETVLHTHNHRVPTSHESQKQTLEVEHSTPGNKQRMSTPVTVHKDSKFCQPRRQTSEAELDFKIEKAMDSVKMELLLTVRKEVKDLKSQVSLLQIQNAHLEEENKILRRAAAPELLARLDSRGETPPPVVI